MKKSEVIIIDGVKYKKCTDCGEVKLATKEYYGTNKYGELGLRSDCKVCKNRKSREYYSKYKDKKREQNRKYAQSEKGKVVRIINKQKRRAMILGNGGNYTKEQWEECLEFFEYRCAYSGESIIDNCHREHIIAINNSGTNYIWNICPSLPNVNLSKQDYGLEEWYRNQSYFSEERLVKIYKWMDYAYEKYGQVVA